jgi:hypothetical protein
MLSFITDMINSYGIEIKSIANKNSVANMLNKLKAFKIKKYEVEISGLEEVIVLFII